MTVKKPKSINPNPKLKPLTLTPKNPKPYPQMLNAGLLITLTYV